MVIKNIDIVDSIYTDTTYSARYGLDIFLTILIVAVLLSIIGYFSVLNNLQSLRSNWDKEKCNPINFPFIHIINPDPNKTPGQQINDNINECLKDGVKGLASDSLKDIYKKFDIFEDLKKYFDEFAEFIQKVFLWLINTIVYLVNLLLSVLQKLFLGFVHMFLKAKDSFDKILGIMVINFFVFIQAFNVSIAFFLNLATMATVSIMVPLGITLAVLILLLIIVIVIAYILSALGLIPIVGIGFLIASGIFWLIVGSLLVGIVACIALMILTAIIMGGLIKIQNTAKRFLTPTITTNTPNVQSNPYYTPNNNLYKKSILDNQISTAETLGNTSFS